MDKNDNELLKLVPFLEKLVEMVRFTTTGVIVIAALVIFHHFSENFLICCLFFSCHGSLAF